MQAAAQRWVDSSISKTINLPNDATVDDVSSAYTSMWRQGCKGGTVYRDGSRTEQVLHAEKEEKIDVLEVVDKKEVRVGLRPPLEHGIGPTFSFQTNMMSTHVSIRCDPETGEPYDLFINAGKGEMGANAQAIARLISIILRWPNLTFIPQVTRLEMVRDQLEKIPGHGQSGIGPDATISFPDGIARVIRKYLEGDFPLSFLPLGEKPLKAMVEALSQHAPKELLDFFFKKEEKPETEEEDSNNPETSKEVHLPPPKTYPILDAQFRRPRFDMCPHCGDSTFKKVAGECPKCVQCGYREC